MYCKEISILFPLGISTLTTRKFWTLRGARRGAAVCEAKKNATRWGRCTISQSRLDPSINLKRSSDRHGSRSREGPGSILHNHAMHTIQLEYRINYHSIRFSAQGAERLGITGFFGRRPHTTSIHAPAAEFPAWCPVLCRSARSRLLVGRSYLLVHFIPLPLLQYTDQGLARPWSPWSRDPLPWSASNLAYIVHA